MRVYQKKSLVIPGNPNNSILSDNQTDYKMIYENIKNYVVFKNSITANQKERLVYMDILDYMEQVRLEATKMK